jgi:hypothetical protein
MMFPLQFFNQIQTERQITLESSQILVDEQPDNGQNDAAAQPFK